jgi:hypothetical protein
MDNRPIFSKATLNHMNYDQKYGCNWIKFDDNIKHIANTEFKLYATGDYSMTSGCIYIALPSNKTLSYSDKMI